MHSCLGLPSPSTIRRSLAGVIPWSRHVEVPLATFTGRNLRLPGRAEQDLASLNGSYPPFAKTADERSNGGDPRPALQERYRSRVHYVRAIAVAAQRLVEQRLLLEEDADRYVALAMQKEGWG
jgi:Alpha/beta hydrolase domain